MIRALRLLLSLALTIGATLPATARASELTDRLEALAGGGNAEALFYLGFAQELGLEGLTADPDRARDLFRRAADAGEPLAAYMVGGFYAEGTRGVPRDAAESLRYCLISAEGGYDIAQFQAAETYRAQGNLDAAIRWYEAAAHQGDRRALGKLFEIHGRGGARPDPFRAYVFLEVNWPLMSREVAQYRTLGSGPNLIDVIRRERRAVERAVPSGERDRARRLAADWEVALTPVTIRARLGFEGARRLARTTG